ncbi:unnamed protein product [Musa banksii]
MESRRKVPTLVELCMDTAIASLRYIEDGRDLSPVTDDSWKGFYEQQFGVESANTVINRMKQKKVVFKWRLLYEAKQKEREEAKNRMAKKHKQNYAESQAKKQSRKIQICSKIPPSKNKRGHRRGIGPSNSLSNVKSNLMKAAKLEYCNSHEAKVHALMRRNALRGNSLSHQSIPRSAKQNNILRSNPDSSSRNGKPVGRKQLLYLIFSGFLMRRKTLVPIEFLQFMVLCHQGASLALVSYHPPVSFVSL